MDGQEMELKVIAKITSGFTEKFGIPRQSGLVSGLRAKIIFEQKYRNPDVIRGIEEFSHLWLIWNFHKAKQQSFHATVAPPRLGGKEKKGIFATRSPFRPNSLGLSSVKLEEIVYEENLGPVLIVSGGGGGGDYYKWSERDSSLSDGTSYGGSGGGFKGVTGAGSMDKQKTNAVYLVSLLTLSCQFHFLFDLL